MDKTWFPPCGAGLYNALPSGDCEACHHCLLKSQYDQRGSEICAVTSFESTGPRERMTV